MEVCLSLILVVNLVELNQLVHIEIFELLMQPAVLTVDIPGLRNGCLF
jgi:hypothetical protein